VYKPCFTLGVLFCAMTPLVFGCTHGSIGAQDEPLDYSHPERFLIRVVLRGESGCNVTRYNVDGACWDEWPNYENMNFRVTIVMVALGESFSGWSNYP